MIDIHTHILPGLDDGAKTLEEAVAMVHMAAEEGTRQIVATPHADLQYSYDLERVEGTIAQLTEACGGVIPIYKGCDFHLYYDNIEDALQNPAKYAINSKRYVLVEFSDLLIIQSADEVFYRMQAAGMVPIITHPERNMLLQKRLERLQKWSSTGVLLQLTAQSFLGRWGREAKAFADELMQRDLVHFVASDAHDTVNRPPLLRAAYEYVVRRWGETRAEALFDSNPKAVLAGDPIEWEPQPQTEAKPWYRFWR
jgi:protein-tyrosine phosphatase